MALQSQQRGLWAALEATRAGSGCEAQPDLKSLPCPPTLIRPFSCLDLVPRCLSLLRLLNKHHRLGVLNHRHLFLPVLEARRAGSGVGRVDSS